MGCKQVYLQEGVYGHHTIHTALASILMVSTLILLANLHFLIQKSFNEQQQIIARLLRRHDATEMKEKAPPMLPVYYTIVLFASFLFSFEALLISVHPVENDQPTLYHIYHHVAYVFSAFLDNWVLLHLLGPFTKYHSFASFFFAAILSSLYMAVVHRDLSLKKRCIWCDVRYPVPEVEVPYLVAVLAYLSIAAAAKIKPLSQKPCSELTMRSYFTPRPAAFIWGCFLASSYALGVLGIHLVERQNNDLGYCMLILSNVEYNSCYAAVLFFTCFADSRLHHNWGMQSALDGVLSPFLSPEAKDETWPQNLSDLTALTANTSWLLSDEARGTLPSFVLELLGDLSVVIIRSSDIGLKHTIGQGGFGEVRTVICDVEIPRFPFTRLFM
jgi:hypothetical protein